MKLKKYFRDLKIKTKLIIIILGTTSFALLFGFSLVTIRNVKEFKSDMIKESVAMAQIAGNSIIGELSFNYADEAKETLLKFKVIPSISNVYIYNEKNELFATFNQDEEDIVPAPQLSGQQQFFKNNYLHVFQPIIYENNKYGTVYLRVSTRLLIQKTRNNILIVVGLIFLLFIISFFLAVKLQKFISDPILHLSNVVNRVSEEGSYDLRLEKTFDDEIGILYMGFNDMLEQIHNREDALKRTQSFLKSVIEAMPSILIALNHEGIVTQWNKAASNLTGITSREAVGMNLWEILPSFKRYQNAAEMVLKQQRSRNYFKEYMELNSNKLYINLSFYPLIVDSLSGIVIRMDDVTEIEKKEQQLRQAQKMETVGTLAGGLAHDFNNVLGGIIGTLSLIEIKMKDKAVKKDGIKKYWEDISKLSNRASDMVNQLLAISRKEELSFSSIDLNFTIRHVVKICNSTFDKSVEINPTYFDKPAKVFADPTQIEQVLLNLCVNASHAMTIMRPDNTHWGGKLKVSLSPKIVDRQFAFHHPEVQGDQYWSVSVSDEGVGMDNDITSQVYDPFFTTKGKGVGTGLGLAMVYNIIKQHKGFIDIESKPGEGTKFIVYLPQYTDIRKETVKRDLTIMSQSGEGLVMVVDDEQILRQIAREILEEIGFDVLLAEDGEEAVALYKKKHEQIRVVLLDMLMPKLSGNEVYVKMRKINPDVKVILTSGFRKDKRVEQALNAGADGFIKKPYNFKRLSEMVFQVLKDSTKSMTD